MEFDILYAIQTIRTDGLDRFIQALTSVAGSYGQIWLILAAVLCLFPKTRRGGIAVFVSYALVFIVGQLALKDLIARPRPCHIDETVALIVSRPLSFSCPSTHTAWSFGAATAIAMNNKRIGIAAFAAAALIAFSRLYLFVHFPTDVLLGMALGALSGVCATYAARAAFRKWGRPIKPEQK